MILLPILTGELFEVIEAHYLSAFSGEVGWSPSSLKIFFAEGVKKGIATNRWPRYFPLGANSLNT